MNLVLWILQVLTAVFFLLHSYSMGVRHEQSGAREGMAYMRDLPAGLRTFIAVCEVLGALGLILPALTGVLPVLSAWAAAGLGLIMLLAIPYHLRRGETRNIGLNAIVLVMAAFVAYGRFVVLPL